MHAHMEGQAESEKFLLNNQKFAVLMILSQERLLNLQLALYLLIFYSPRGAQW